MSRVRAVGMFLALSLMWGLSFPAIKVGLDFVPPVLFAAFRYDVGGILLLAYVVFATDTPLPRGRTNTLAALAGGVFLIAANVFLFVGQQTVNAGVSGLLQGFVPVMTALFALVLLPDERVTPVGAVGILIGLVGVGLIVRPDPSNLLAGNIEGKLLILTQVGFVALGGVLVRRLGPSVPQATLSAWSMVIGGAILHVAAVTVGDHFADVVVAPTAVLAVVYLGVFSTALAFIIYFTILDEFGALQTSLVAYLVPVVATVASVLLFPDEGLDPATVAGFAVVVAGFLVLERQAVRSWVADVVDRGTTTA